MVTSVEAAVSRGPSTRILGASLALAALAACGGGGGGGGRVMTARMGAVYGPKGASCAIRFENLNHQEAYAKYEMLGLVTVYDVESGLTPPVKKQIEREACKIGGDAVTLNAGMADVLQFSVWRAK